jgi:hypothetical protein
MAGKIVGCYGYQRQGKTLLAVYIALKLKEVFGLEVYTNMSIPGCVTVDSINKIPFDYKPKVFLVDEIYFSLDSRNWKDNTSCSIFINTIGKQNILFLYTAISPDMVEMRIRKQTEFMFFAKKNKDYIEYGLLDCYRNVMSTIYLPLSKELFAFTTYDTTQVPYLVDFNINFKKYFDLVKLN